MAEQERRADANAAPTMQAAARAQAEAEAKAAARQADEAPDGGRFMVDGVLVDSDGIPVKSKAKDA